MGEEDHKSRSGPASAPSLAAASADPANRFGKYVRLARLGTGRVADVWLAYDTAAKREVSLKLLVRGDAEERQKLAREARAAAPVSHPNIVPILEVGRAAGIDYIAAEYVRGTPLSRTGVDILDAARLVRDAALAVQHAHGLGILHRDLKPGNLFLDEGRRVRVADFGQALTVSFEGRAVGGTPVYMAPEVAKGSASTADVRSDVYGLGATLYELATADPPYRGATEEDVIRRVLAEEPAAPRRIDPRVPADLEAIILKAMARDPWKRYGSAAEMAEDLRRFLDGEPVGAARGSAKWVWVAIGAGAAVAAAVAAWVVL